MKFPLKKLGNSIRWLRRVVIFKKAQQTANSTDDSLYLSQLLSPFVINYEGFIV